MNQTNATNNPTPNAFAKKSKSTGAVLSSIFTIAFVIFALLYFNGFFKSSYYVAKYQDYNAAAIQIDGYMHKDKTCCQKVADFYDAKVIKVKPDDEAAKNAYGQSLKYKDCFKYCPLCCYD